MSYQVMYETGKKKSRHCRLGLLSMILAAWIGFASLVNIYWPKGWAVLSSFMIPETTTAAFHSFVDDLKSGTAFPKALEAFCYEVVQGAN